jgi:hypothetical protein
MRTIPNGYINLLFHSPSFFLLLLLWKFSNVYLQSLSICEVEGVAMNSIQLAEINAIFTGVYVVLTLILAGTAIWSFRVGSKQSRDALLSSENYSQEALVTVHEQIAASEQQAREALYNQHKPVVVPTNPLYRKQDGLEMRNAGSGIALNTWGVLTIVSATKVYRFDSTLFLLPERVQAISLVEISNNLDVLFPGKEFHGYSLYPPPDRGSIGTAMRLMLTYNDIFGNRHLGVYDYSGFGWRLVETMKRIEQRLDAYLEEKRSHLSEPTDDQ